MPGPDGRSVACFDARCRLRSRDSAVTLAERSENDLSHEVVLRA